MRRLCFLLFFFSSPFLLSAQSEKVPVLEREITLIINNEPVYQVLDEISKKADFVFSYSSDAIDANSIISLNIRQKSVRHILNTIFNGAVKYKVRGKYVILQKDELYVESLKSKKQKVTVEGYVSDVSGKKLSDATIYNKDALASATTDKYGYFKIELPPDTTNADLRISRQGFTDTILDKIDKKKNYVTVEMSSVKKDTTDSLKNKTSLRNLSFSNVRSKFSHFLISQKVWISSLNIKDTVFKKVQISFIPFISTNKFFTGNSINNFSFNVIAGYIQELRGLEIGGVQNIVRNDARIAEIGGVGNIVGGSFEGFQCAGVYNVTSKSFNGFQCAGVFNTVKDKFTGAQVSGVWNSVDNKISGAQIAGVFNITETLAGTQIGGVFNVVNIDSGACQIAGVTNISGKTFEGTQIAGVNNVAQKINGAQIAGVLNNAENIKGLQIAGVANFASKLDGTQIAGVLNSANEVDGIQISGCMNQASYFNGTQISVVNLADSCDGIAIGLFNYVKKGYHKIELSADEIFYSNIAFRTGTRYFHNLFFTGIQPDKIDNSLWTYGYGIGTTLGNSGKVNYDIDVSAQQIVKGTDFSFRNDLFKIYAGIDLKLFSKISVACGITYNFLLTDTENSLYTSSYSKIAPYSFSNTTGKNGMNLKTWLGGKVAIRFL